MLRAYEYLSIPLNFFSYFVKFSYLSRAFAVLVLAITVVIVNRDVKGITMCSGVQKVYGCLGHSDAPWITEGAWFLRARGICF